MSQVRCNWCLSEDVVLRGHGAVAPWILLAPPDERGLTELWECQECELNFFSRGFSEAELDLLYSEYRGPAYFRRRHHWEPWYTKEINNGIGHNTETVLHRRRHLETFINVYVERYLVAPPTAVVDFGGDEGQFMPEIDTIQKCGVFEVSDSVPVTGVQKLATWGEVADFRPDLMMLCHVLEHTTESRDIVGRAYDSLKIGALLYIEVPLDRPPTPPKVFKTFAYRNFTKWVYRSRIFWILLDFITLVSKRYLKRVPVGGVIKQNEHVQFFDRRAFANVLAKMGFVNVEFSEYVASGTIPRLQTSALGVLAMKAG